MGLGIDNLPAIIVVKPKKKRYAVFSSTNFQINEIKSFVDEVMGGFI